MCVHKNGLLKCWRNNALKYGGLGEDVSCKINSAIGS